MKDDTVSDYAIIDLGVGDQWLTSRLFIFSIMLKHMRNLRCFAFLETRGNTRRRFMGTATPDSVRRALGHRYPYLEDAFDKIYSDPMYSHVRTQPASLQPADAINISGSFIQEIQGPPPLPNEEREWVTLEDRSIWEHVEWLDGELVERALGDDLDDSWVETSPDTPSEELAKKILRRNGSFVALVDEERVFQSLVDRYALLERVAKDLTETNIAG